MFNNLVNRFREWKKDEEQKTDRALANIMSCLCYNSSKCGNAGKPDFCNMKCQDKNLKPLF